MKNKGCFILITLAAITVLSDSLKGQTLLSSLPEYKSNYRTINDSSSSPLPIAVGVAVFLYLINPILVYEDKKLYAGITKEISMGFGNFGQHRAAFEYSLIFGGKIRHFFRVSYKYDILLNGNIEPSHMLQGTSVVSAGAGLFTDFTGSGFFPEISYGYSLRNHKLLIYPHIKLRQTFMFNKTKSNIFDISFGIMVGFANPFGDVKITRKY